MKRRFLILLVVIGLPVFMLFRLNQLNQIPLQLENFSLWNKVEIYTLGLVMCTIAYPLYPEIAREHLMMYRPFDDKPKVLQDDFFLKSKTVQAAIKQSQRSGKAARLAWPASAYLLSFEPEKYWEARIALALNGGWVVAEGGSVTAVVPIAYPKRAFAPLITVPDVGVLGVEEGLFNILQQAGWY